ncbi:MAG: hypothetical protein JNM34_10105 [Chthonomonadaceae bacterium]|nr:hypothetical protein [Chthonomonadaceae bacterium]
MYKLALVPFLASAMVASPVQNTPSQPDPADFNRVVKPFLKKYCYSCHDDQKAEEGINYAKIKTASDAMKNPRMWRKAAREVAGKKMPPKDSSQPTSKERKAFLDWCDKLPKR